MEENSPYTQEQLKEMWEAARAAEAPLQHLTFISALGGPGSGQAAQCARLAQRLGFGHIDVGAVVREEAGRAGAVDARAAFGALRRRVEEEAAAALGQKTFIISGFPRSLAGLRCFEETIAPVKLVMYLDRSEDMLVQRLLERGRAGDDTWPEVVRKGVAAFLAEARPVLKHLEARATRAQMYCHVVGWGDDDQLALDMRLAVEEALKK